MADSRSFVIGLLKKKFFRHGYRKYEFPQSQGKNHKKFSNTLKAEISPRGYRDIIFHFLKDAAPDITGVIKEEYSSAFIAVEVKNDEIKLDDIYQTKRYAELFDAKYPLLISTKEIPEEIKRLSKVVHKLLSGGYAYEKIILVHFDPATENFVDWFEKSPF